MAWKSTSKSNEGKKWKAKLGEQERGSRLNKWEDAGKQTSLSDPNLWIYKVIRSERC